MKRLIIFLLLVSCQGLAPKLWGQGASTTPEPLNDKDRFQMDQWLRLARGAWEVGDYSTASYFCRLILEHYPNTYYSREAKSLLKNSSSPVVNSARDHVRSNPGLFLR